MNWNVHPSLEECWPHRREGVIVEQVTADFRSNGEGKSSVLFPNTRVWIIMMIDHVAGLKPNQPPRKRAYLKVPKAGNALMIVDQKCVEFLEAPFKADLEEQGGSIDE